VLAEIRDRLPYEHTVYFGDTARVPYGVRDLAEVRWFTFEIINYLIGMDVKLVVIACNTATAAPQGDAALVRRSHNRGHRAWSARSGPGDAQPARGGSSHAVDGIQRGLQARRPLPRRGGRGTRARPVLSSCP
jgi:hypothetical protein